MKVVEVIRAPVLQKTLAPTSISLASKVAETLQTKKNDVNHLHMSYSLKSQRKTVSNAEKPETAGKIFFTTQADLAVEVKVLYLL